MTIKKLTLTAAVAMCSLHLSAQESRVNFGMEYTTEMQSNFRAVNWVNQLHLSAEANLFKGLNLEIGSFSVAKTRDERLIDDLQVFSNIEEDNLPLAISVFGLHWTSRNENETLQTELFAGIRNVNEDYFTSPCTSLFTNSSCGIFPTISANYDIANYPLTSVCIDFRQSWKDWSLQASIYNGQGYNRFTGSENIFRVNPAKDGVFGIAALNFEPNENSYSAGCALHLLGNQASCAPWLNIEQSIGNHLHILAQGSVNFAAAPECKHYEALGLVANFGKTESGLIINHATFAQAHEYAAELTSQIHITPSIDIQPSLHIIRTGKTTSTIALFRLIWHFETK